MRNLFHLGLVAALLSAVGCAKEPGKISVEIRDGHTTHKGQLSLDAGWAAVGEGATPKRVDVKAGKLSALGKDYGDVAAGDTVVLDEKDRLTVNGRPRDPR